MNKNLNILITPKAKSDISQISDFISNDNPKTALALIDLFYKTFELISEYPMAGIVKDNIKDKTVRIYIVKKNFVIVYRIKNNAIEILRILTRYQNLLTVIN